MPRPKGPQLSHIHGAMYRFHRGGLSARCVLIRAYSCCLYIPGRVGGAPLVRRKRASICVCGVPAGKDSFSPGKPR